jgi:hypothetical protein
MSLASLGEPVGRRAHDLLSKKEAILSTLLFKSPRERAAVRAQFYSLVQDLHSV